jgi:ribosome biogenesis protein ENP2
VGKEDTSSAVFQDYKFVARSDLARLGLAQLEGTPLLRAYMHGFFVDRRLYQRAVASSDPDAFDRWQAAKATKKTDADDRILLDTAQPKRAINAKLAEKLKKTAAAAAASASSSSSSAAGAGLVGDSRFSAVFSDPSFAIDDDAAEFFDLRRSKGPSATSGKAGDDDDSEAENEADGDDEDDEGREDVAGHGRGVRSFRGVKPGRAAPRASGKRERTAAAASLGAILKSSHGGVAGSSSGTAAAAAAAGAADSNSSRGKDGLGEVRFVEGGGREVSFVPKRTKGKWGTKKGDTDGASDSAKKHKKKTTKSGSKSGSKGRR